MTNLTLEMRTLAKKLVEDVDAASRYAQLPQIMLQRADQLYEVIEQIEYLENSGQQEVTE